jgi:hypothetical protein
MAPASPVNLSPTAWENRSCRVPPVGTWVSPPGPESVGQRARGPLKTPPPPSCWGQAGADALLFARHGFQVTAVDFAPWAIAALTEAAKAEQLSVTGLQQDVFALLPAVARTKPITWWNTPAFVPLTPASAPPMCTWPPTC